MNFNGIWSLAAESNRVLRAYEARALTVMLARTIVAYEKPGFQPAEQHEVKCYT